MRIAVTYNNGMVYPHYSRTPQLKIYDVVAGRIVATEIVMAYGSMRRSSVTDLLRDYKVDVIICGRMGVGTRLVLSALGIKIVDRASGSADYAVSVYTGINMGYYAPQPPVRPPAAPPMPRYRLTAKDRPPVQPPVRTPQPKPPVQPPRKGPQSSKVAPSPYERSAKGYREPQPKAPQAPQPARTPQPAQPSSRGGGFRKSTRNGRFK